MKTIHYENSKVSRIDYKIVQAFGIGGRCVVDKTIIYNTDGTKEKINNKRNRGAFDMKIR